MYYFQGFRSQGHHVFLSSINHFIVSIPFMYLLIIITMNLNIARNTIGIRLQSFKNFLKKVVCSLNYLAMFVIRFYFEIVLLDKYLTLNTSKL